MYGFCSWRSTRCLGATPSFCKRPEGRGVAELEFQCSVKAGSLLRHCSFSDKAWLHVHDGADVIRELAGSRKTQTYCQELLLLLLRLGLTPVALSLLHTHDFPCCTVSSNLCASRAPSLLCITCPVQNPVSTHLPMGDFVPSDAPLACLVLWRQVCPSAARRQGSGDAELVEARIRIS